MRRRTCTLLAALAAAALLAGCSSTSTGPGEAEGEQERTSPGLVVQQLATAYEDMDFERFADCLADSFAFHLSASACDDDSIIPDAWSRSMEDTVHRRMFRGFEFDQGDTVLQMRVTLVMIDSTYSAGDDTLNTGDDRWVLSMSADVMAFCTNDLQYWADCDQRFTLAIDPGETGTEGEPLYEIIEWEDIDPWKHGDDNGTVCGGSAGSHVLPHEGRKGVRVENASWSHLKLLFADL
ncbi:MAG: hypothetical protein GF405_03655 [Candidatus Eisenbacteria bacterium]|nr:hypothetical protein [Candidatus Eisenbacteria bacterium]